MNKSGKTLLSAVVALGLGTLVVPTSQAIAASNHPTMSSNPIAYQQYAEDEEHHDVVDRTEEKVDQKVDEGRDMGTGAAHAVRRAHHRHEISESRHHGLRAKTDAKIDEMHDEATGATNAVETTHQRHENAEGHE